MESPIIQETPPSYTVKPLWSPLAISWVSLLGSPIPALVMAAINFGRIGQAQKKKLWLLYALLSALIYCILMFRFSMLPDSESNFLRPLTVGYSIAIAWKLYLSQSKLFERHIQQGGRKSTVWGPIFGSLLWFAVIIGVGFGGALIVESQINREFNRAALLLEKGQTQQAEEIYKGVKARFPDETNAYVNLALIYDDTGRVELAKHELRQALVLEPNSNEIRNYLESLETPE